MVIETQRLTLVLLAEQHAEDLSRFYNANKMHLSPWEPERATDYHTEEAWRQRCVDFQAEHEAGVSLRLLAYMSGQQNLIGTCFFTNISRGVFQACHLGYAIAEEFGGKGLMTEIVAGSIEYVFTQLNLHRVMANYMPENTRSARVLEKLGFEKEGYAKSYLKIAGEWRDHVLTAKVNPDHGV